MKIRRYILATLLAVLHLIFTGLFFYAYFISDDPVRGIALYIFHYIDPLVYPLLGVVTHLYGDSEAMIAAFIIVFGTVQWFIFGWIIQWLLLLPFVAYKNMRAEQGAADYRRQSPPQSER
jgi:hypothetical protein